MVFDVPAESGGALSILNDFYEEVKDFEDQSIKWIFVVSKPKYRETENIKILRFPWVKKSWFHRLYFDQFIAPSLVKKYGVNQIFSLQNVVVPRTKVEQVLYVHQPLPFVEYNFKFKDNKLFWIYQKIISKLIYKSIKKSKKVIVQMNWFKEECIKKTNVSDDKIVVVPPRINIEINKYYTDEKRDNIIFFYPSGSSYYKNHYLIVKACDRLVKKGYNNFTIIFTLKGNETSHISNLYEEVKNKNLPIKFLGEIDREQVFDYYSSSILLFPSYIETFGLPLLEAKLHGSIILASKTPFSEDILSDYPNAKYFNPFNHEELVMLMEEILNDKFNYKKTVKSFEHNINHSLIHEILK